MRVTATNQIEYRFFEKPTSSKMCLQADTALAQNGLVQYLVQDVMRRMLNCSSHIPIVSRREVIDNFGQKMVNSGHTIQEVRRILISGLKGWRSKLDRRKTTNQPVHRSARQSSDSRRFKKLTWFKEKKPSSQPDEEDRVERAGEAEG